MHFLSGRKPSPPAAPPCHLSLEQTSLTFNGWAEDAADRQEGELGWTNYAFSGASLCYRTTARLNRQQAGALVGMPVSHA